MKPEALIRHVQRGTWAEKLRPTWRGTWAAAFTEISDELTI